MMTAHKVLKTSAEEICCPSDRFAKAHGTPKNSELAQ
jgi:hypothetical protein